MPVPSSPTRWQGQARSIAWIRAWRRHGGGWRPTASRIRRWRQPRASLDSPPRYSTATSPPPSPRRRAPAAGRDPAAVSPWCGAAQRCAAHGPVAASRHPLARLRRSCRKSSWPSGLRAATGSRGWRCSSNAVPGEIQLRVPMTRSIERTRGQSGTPFQTVAKRGCPTGAVNGSERANEKRGVHVRPSAQVCSWVMVRCT
jgi:hypothetical protein